MNISKSFLIAGSISAGTGVALGAFGAHGLKNTLTPEMLAVFETAVRYQMYHAFALLFTGILSRAAEDSIIRTLRLAGLGFSAGTILFCGSLYLLVLSDQRWLGAITPLGGLAFIAGWLLFAWSFIRRN